MYQFLRKKFVSIIYADHNRSRKVELSLAKVLSRIDDSTFAINIGAGETRLHPKIKNVDILGGQNIDYIASAESLPFSDESIDVIVSQETIEHVRDPFKSLKEFYRVLKPGG
jgi:ubiquinone/menaquinone biosynthesis C-methylase UbiE